MIESAGGVEKAGVDSVTVAGPQPAGKSVRSITLHALAAALMYVSPLAVFVPAAFISSGLRNGRRGTWGAIAASAAIVMAAMMVGRSSPMATVNLAAVLRLLLEIGIPSAAAIVLVKRGAPLAQVILVGVGIAALGFFATEVLMRRGFEYSPYDAIVGNFRQASERTMDAYRRVGMAEEGLRMMGRFSAAVANSFMPFLLIAVSVLTFVMSLVMIPRLPAGRATGETYLFRNLSWPDGLLLLFIAGGIAPLVRGPARMFLLNVLAVAALMYLLQGLAIFRTLLIRMGLQFFGTTLAYVLLGLLTFYGIAPFILFLAGLFDPFFDFRNLQRKGESDESHLD
jgi:hypothetical protein